MSPTPLSSRKRALSSQEDMPESKRRRTPLSDTAQLPEAPAPSETSSPIITAHEVAKKGLRRSIALVLDKVGFDAASEQAMESFATIVETYISSLVRDVHTFANASRRTYPIPTDFETSLARFNVSVPALKPHVKPPVPRTKRQPTWEAFPLGEDTNLSLPILGDELSGTPEKEARLYIPKSFPSFPSIHTYRYTPQNAEDVTVSSDWPTAEPDLIPSQARTAALSQTQTNTQTQTRPLAPDEIPRGDPKKMREAAAKEAKAGEEALRRLMRASKIAKQKDVWTTAQREPARRERYDLWESAMREMIEEDARAKGRANAAPAVGHAATSRFEIADHSMIVNAEGKYQRKEVPRAAVRKVTAGEIGMGKA